MYDYLHYRLLSLGYSEKAYFEISDHYAESIRFYHNMNHILFMLRKAEQIYHTYSDTLFLVIVFHDIIYDVKSSINEEESVKEFSKYESSHKEYFEDVCIAILQTKNHDSKTELSKQLNNLDLAILHSNFYDFMLYEDGIFKEFQYVDYNTYLYLCAEENQLSLAVD